MACELSVAADVCQVQRVLSSHRVAQASVCANRGTALVTESSDRVVNASGAVWLPSAVWRCTCAISDQQEAGVVVELRVAPWLDPDQ